MQRMWGVLCLPSAFPHSCLLSFRFSAAVCHFCFDSSVDFPSFQPSPSSGKSSPPPLTRKRRTRSFLSFSTIVYIDVFAFFNNNSSSSKKKKQGLSCRRFHSHLTAGLNAFRMRRFVFFLFKLLFSRLSSFDTNTLSFFPRTFSPFFLLYNTKVAQSRKLVEI
ncbi:hypothetical protein ABB37_04985 [Leptomonas pyrrhocoris]|uniref:Secreted protein n=1 Tax=Leptomonas pyrrhocoris TaxID=157538 RepID=A0A0M9G0U9_LEPPY|nr:hypothetical protein ABB37_04985 [Leptomonas pyrrhocoris]KPA79933.1 hypothetical protein ABB37_04985 [Leptomonas pyrrhocoris]|eukprot:XP_015658372.1 hypothetical protein ABB37_04985 [Leptomonas pyrrhocoris]